MREVDPVYITRCEHIQPFRLLGYAQLMLQDHLCTYRIKRIEMNYLNFTLLVWPLKSRDHWCLLRKQYQQIWALKRMVAVC